MGARAQPLGWGHWDGAIGMGPLGFPGGWTGACGPCVDQAAQAGPGQAHINNCGPLARGRFALRAEDCLLTVSESAGWACTCTQPWVMYPDQVGTPASSRAGKQGANLRAAVCPRASACVSLCQLLSAAASCCQLLSADVNWRQLVFIVPCQWPSAGKVSSVHVSALYACRAGERGGNRAKCGIRGMRRYTRYTRQHGTASKTLATDTTDYVVHMYTTTWATWAHGHMCHMCRITTTLSPYFARVFKLLSTVYNLIEQFQWLEY